MRFPHSEALYQVSLTFNITAIILQFIIQSRRPSPASKVKQWVSLMSHLTLYRSFRGWFLQARSPNQQRQSTEGSQLTTKIGFCPTRTTPPCYNMNHSAPPLGYAQCKGPSVTKTESARCISCIEHCATRALHHSIVTRAAVLMFPLLLQTIIINQMRPCR